MLEADASACATVPARLVVAEDDETTRVLLRTMLELVPELELVAEAKNGAEAVELAVEADADVVLLDVNMPLLDGLDAAVLLRELLPEARLVVYTSEPDAEKRRRAAELGIPILVKGDFSATISALCREIGGIGRAA